LSKEGRAFCGGSIALAEINFSKTSYNILIDPDEISQPADDIISVDNQILYDMR
jgi:hypothetical protein